MYNCTQTDFFGLQLIVDNEIYMYNDLTGQVEQVYSPTLRAISPNPGSGMGSSMGYADGMPYAATPQFGSTMSLRAPSPSSAPADAPRNTRVGSRGKKMLKNRNCNSVPLY